MDPLFPDEVGELRLRLGALEVRYDRTTQRLDRIYQILVEWRKGQHDDTGALESIQSIVNGYDQFFTPRR